LSYKLSSDIDWEIQVLKKSQTILKSQAPICNYLMGGASVQNLQRSWKERYQVLKNHFGFFDNGMTHEEIVEATRSRGWMSEEVENGFL
jgi:hypothetical protein